MMAQSMLSNKSGKELIFLRGVPGSGKTFLATQLVRGGVILSTNCFYLMPGGQQELFREEDMHLAEKWNQKRCEEAIKTGRTPIIIDGPNLTVVDMKPYAVMALQAGYDLQMREPSTPWKYEAEECAKRSVHSLSVQMVQAILDKFQKDLTVQDLLRVIPDKERTSQDEHQPQPQPANLYSTPPPPYSAQPQLHWDKPPPFCDLPPAYSAEEPQTPPSLHEKLAMQLEPDPEPMLHQQQSSYKSQPAPHLRQTHAKSSIQHPQKQTNHWAKLYANKPKQVQQPKKPQPKPQQSHFFQLVHTLQHSQLKPQQQKPQQSQQQPKPQHAQPPQKLQQAKQHPQKAQQTQEQLKHTQQQMKLQFTQEQLKLQQEQLKLQQAQQKLKLQHAQQQLKLLQIQQPAKPQQTQKPQQQQNPKPFSQSNQQQGAKAKQQPQAASQTQQSKPQPKPQSNQTKSGQTTTNISIKTSSPGGVKVKLMVKQESKSSKGGQGQFGMQKGKGKK